MDSNDQGFNNLTDFDLTNLINFDTLMYSAFSFWAGKKQGFSLTLFGPGGL